MLRPIILNCLLPLLALAACDARRLPEYRLSGPTMGTQFNITVVARGDFEQQSLQRTILDALDDVERRMSTYRPDSELAQFNRSASTDWISVSPQLCKAVEVALEIGRMTEGAFDITVGPLVDLWGFGPGASRSAPPADAVIDTTRNEAGSDKLHADCAGPALRKDRPGLQIDLSGYAKGLAADEISAILQQYGILNYLVELGGDLRVAGRNADNERWRIAIERPDRAGRRVEKIIRVSDIAVATSGDYRNFFEHDGRRYSHTIDPGTGRPVTHNLASVTVLGDSADYADAMATALLVMGPEAGPAFAERQRIAAYFLLRNGNEYGEKTSTRFRQLTGR